MRRLYLLVLVVPALLALAAGPAHASCLFDGRDLDQIVAATPVAFVGTAVEVTNLGRTARFEVDEVWSGEVPAELVVHGGPDDPNAATSVDRSFEAGTVYLVAPTLEGGRYTDNSCSPTRPFDDEVAAARPATARAPDAAAPDASGVDDSDGSTSLLLPVTGAILLLAGGAVVVALRAGRRSA